MRRDTTQAHHGTFRRAAALYDEQMLDRLNPLMREYLARQEMAFVSTSDAEGACDSSFRAGPPGFVRVLDDRTVMYPEYRGSRVMASPGNVGLLFVDFFYSGVGLHINGRARIIEHAAVEAFAPLLRRVAGIDELEDVVAGRRETPERWVLVDIVAACIHCSEQIPILAHLPESAGHMPPARVEGIDAFLEVIELDDTSAPAPASDTDELSYLLPPAWEAAGAR